MYSTPACYLQNSFSFHDFFTNDFSNIKEADYMQRVDLVQDLRFETATSRIKDTPDGEYLIASGEYL